MDLRCRTPLPLHGPSSMSRSKDGASGTSARIGRARVCCRPDRASITGDRVERVRRDAPFPVSSARASANMRHRTSDVSAASTPADRSTSSNDRDPHGRRPPSWARSRSGARSSNMNGDGEADSHTPRGSDSSAPCAHGSSRAPASRRSCTPSGPGCTRSARAIGVASKCPTDAGRDPRPWTHERSNPDSIETYAVDLVPEEAVRSLFERSSTVARPYFPSISVVPIAEAGDPGERSGIDAFRSLLGWPKRRGPDYNE